MGWAAFYQALPEDCDLHRVLAIDRMTPALLQYFWPQGSRPLDLREAGDEDVEDLLEYYSRHHVANLDEVRAVFEYLETEIRGTAIRHPGLIERTAFLEKSHEPILGWIEARWAELGRDDGPRFGQQLLFGNVEVSTFGKLDAAFLREAVRFFREPGFLPSSSTDDALWWIDELRSLADLCAAASERDEIILMCSS